MKANMLNRTHIEGVLYQHSLQKKVTGENSQKPGTEFITGTIEVATDNAMVNIVPIHFTYVTAVTSTGKANSAYTVLNDIVNGSVKSVMDHGKDAATKLRIDSAIGLNDFYTEREGKVELVSAKRNEGGFIHVANDGINEDEKLRNTFEVDMVITNVRRVEADEERDLPEKVVIKGAIFDFRKSLLPVEFTAENPHAMDYFEGLEASASNPVFTKLKGRQISETIVKKIVEESAFGEASVREVKNTRKDFVITGASKETYMWDEEGVLTAAEVAEMVAARETYLATMKQRQEEYKAQKAAEAATPAAPAAGGAGMGGMY